MKIHVATILFAMLLFHASSQAQEVHATARVDSNNIFVGGQVGLHVEVQHSDNIFVTWPSLTDSLEGLEIVDRFDSSIQKSNQSVTESRSYHITSFDSGTYYLPPFVFRYTLKGDTTRRAVQTSAILIVVHGVEVDTSKDLRDIKPPLGVAISFEEILPYLLVAVGVGGLAWLVYYIMKKRKRGESILPEEPSRPAHEIALEGLRSLESEQLWQRGKVKEYHSMLTDILRVYIERRFKVMAMEMTTDEIMSAFTIVDLETDVKRKLKEILVRADYVKFAKFQPAPQENDTSMKLAFEVVESTWHPTIEQVNQEVAEEVKS